jgi:hypothetical protein
LFFSGLREACKTVCQFLRKRVQSAVDGGKRYRLTGFQNENQAAFLQPIASGFSGLPAEWGGRIIFTSPIFCARK